MLKILQARLQQYMNFQMEVQDVQDVQAGFRKGQRTGDQIANIHWVLVLEVLVGVHRAIQLQLLQHYSLGHRLGLL